jgi:hypothetical protein
MERLMSGTKYEPLGRHLAGVRFSEWRASFSEIEAILCFPLPRSARTYAAWWGNDSTSHTQAAAWLDVGWRTEQVEIGGERVVFRRDISLHRQSRPTPSSLVSVAPAISPSILDPTFSPGPEQAPSVASKDVSPRMDELGEKFLQHSPAQQSE